jgi:hypothetical protein
MKNARPGADRVSPPHWPGVFQAIINGRDRDRRRRGRGDDDQP